MNNTVEINLIGEYSININSSYELSIQICNGKDLTEYDGYSQIINGEGSIILNPTIEIINKDIFKIKVFPNNFNINTEAGVYIYDVLFVGKTNPNDRFYPIGGKCQFVKRVSQIL